MSHTNSTANYNLPQFVGTDTPAWLTDVNGAMRAIDSQMKTNADSASTANASATTANSNIGTLASLNTTAKTDLVSAVNEINTGLGTVSGVASSASGTATQANNAIEALTKYLDINDFGTLSVSGSTGLNVRVNNLRYATNDNGTLGKIYGLIIVTPTTTGPWSITLSSPFRPESAITINGAIDTNIINDSQIYFQIKDLTIGTNGDITITGTGDYNATVRMYLPPCLYFFKNFGDTPIEG